MKLDFDKLSGLKTGKQVGKLMNIASLIKSVKLNVHTLQLWLPNGSLRHCNKKQ